MNDIPWWVYIGLLAQLLWVIGNLLDKYLIETFFKGEDDEDESTGTLLIFSALFSLLLSCGIWLLWSDTIATDSQTALWGLGIGLANVVWLLAYLYAIAKSELTTTVPIFQTIPLFGFIYGFILLGETVTTMQFIAASSLLVGSFVLSYNFTARTVNWMPLLLMLLASATLSLEDVLFKVVAIDNNFVTSAFWQGIGLGISGILLYLCVPNYRRQFNSFLRGSGRTIWGVSFINEVFDNAATLVFSYAVIIGPIMLVQSVNAYQPITLLIVSYVIAVFFGNYLREDISYVSMFQKFLGIGLITVASLWLYNTL
jgi:drug/metabolite transporter (DMT)-like permease